MTVAIDPATTAAEAINLADWHLRYAQDRLDGTEHRGLGSALAGARTQLTAAIKLSRPTGQEI